MPRALTLAGAGAACIALGYLAAASTSPSPSPSSNTAAGPTRVVAGVALGYPRTRAGATLAAKGYQQAFADPAILRPGVLAERIEAIATPAFAKTMLAANEPGAARLRAGAIGQGIEAGTETAYFAVPLGYRLLSYSPERARVLIWGFTVLGNATAAEPAAYFGTARTELLWEGGDWKIASTRAAFGPTPALSTPTRSGEGFEVIDLLAELHPYGIAP